MAKKVTGYLSIEGKFFETKEEAEFADAEYMLHKTFNNGLNVPPGLTFTNFVRLVHEFTGPLEQYLRTREALHSSADTSELEEMTKGTVYDGSSDGAASRSTQDASASPSGGSARSSSERTNSKVS